MKRLVADTGPLLHLHETGALHLLPLIGITEIAPIVLTELCGVHRNESRRPQLRTRDSRELLSPGLIGTPLWSKTGLTEEHNNRLAVKY